MIVSPIFSKLSEKTYDIILLLFVTIMYIAVCAEADIYVSAFPQMIDYFQVSESQIQLILSINFAGLSVASLFVGPVSDCYGRRQVLLYGLLLFLISSIGCVMATSFSSMLIWRLLQGIASAVPIVVGAATLFDRHSSKKAGQLTGIMNSVIATTMAGSPIVGAWVSKIFNWRANFILILIIAMISFLGTLFFIKETLPANKRIIFSFTTIYKNYMKLFKSFSFLGYTIIVNFAVTAIIVYIANLSIIYINYIGLTLEEFSYYQTTTMGTFIIFSILSVKMISKKGMNYTQNFGGTLALLGAISIFCISKIDYKSVNIISLSMAILAGGGAIMAGTFGLKAISVFPDIKGTSLAMMTTIRHFLASVLVLLSEFLFDGTIVPIAIIIFTYAVICVIIFIVLKLNI